MTSRGLFRAERLLDLGAAIGPVLGLDTGAPTASIGLVAHGRVVAETARTDGPHGASLPAAVQELLGAAGVGVRELAGIAVAIGPGSFTGLRVSLSYAKGLAAASRCPMAGVPSLDALALCALGSKAALPGAAICTILDARKGEVYAALYRAVPDGLEKLSDDLVVTLERLIPRIPDGALLAGDHSAADAQSLIGAQRRRARALTGAELPQRGGLVAALGAMKLACGEAGDPVKLEPLYVRPPGAAFNLAGAKPIDAGAEGLWSREKSNSSSGMQPMTRS